MECDGNEYFPESEFLIFRGMYTSFFYNPKHFAEMRTTLLVRMTLIIFGVFPLAANIFSFTVLGKPQLRKEQPTFRGHLVLLTLTEVFYTVTFVNFFFWDVLFGHLATKQLLGNGPAIIVTLSASIVYAAQATRNWMVATISAARCEAITRPLASLNKKFITTRRIHIFVGFTAVATISISLIYHFSNVWSLVCKMPLPPPPHLLNASSPINGSLPNYPRFEYLLSVGTRRRTQFLTSYFRGVPISIVVLNTVLMIVAINFKNPAISQGNQAQTRSASITLIGFTTLFSIFEGFGFSYFLSLSLVKNMGFSEAVGLFLYIFDKYLLLINSMTNVIAYVAFNKTFRSIAMSMLCPKKYAEKQAANKTTMVSLSTTAVSRNG